MSTTDLSSKLKEYADLKKKCDLDGLRLALLHLGLYANGAPSPSEEEKQEMTQLSEQSDRLQQIRDELRFALLNSDLSVISDGTLHQVARELRKELAAEEIDAAWDGDWLPNILGQCFPEEYATRLADLKPLVMLYQPPENLRVLVREGIRAYCLELPTATVAVSRSMVEVAVVDIAIRIGRVKDEAEIAKMRMCDRISSLIDRSVSKQSPLRQRINSFIGTASEIVHGNKAADMDEARRHLEAAFQLIKELYANYRGQYRTDLASA